jgi:hypothetical protein
MSGIIDKSTEMIQATQAEQDSRRKAIRRREKHFTHDLTGQDEECFYE